MTAGTFGRRSAPDISVVIPTRDRRDLLLEALHALGTQTLPAERYEVIPVVDGSGDGTAEALVELQLPYEIRPIVQAPMGRAAACNAGIRSAQGSVVVLLDDDMLPSDRFLEAHMQAHAAGGRIGVLGPAPIPPGSGDDAVRRYVRKKFDRHLAKLAAGAPIGFRELYTGNFSARTEDLRAVGLFDERFEIYGNEDGELGIRLLEAGIELRFDGSALAWQRFTKTFADLARDNEAKGRTAVILARKHPNARSRLKLSARPSRKLRLGRETLFLLTRLSSSVPQALIVGFGLLERVSPSLAEYLCPALLDYFYWRGARAQTAGDLSQKTRPRSRERARNTLLRRVDWRFLLPDPSPRSVVSYDSGLAKALTTVSASLNDPSDARGCDLAVLVDPDQRALTAARVALGPGGVCYVEWRPLQTVSAIAVKRRLTRAGFEAVRCYWPWPRRSRAHVWLPLDSTSAVHYYLATRAPRRSLPVRIAHETGHAIAIIAVRLGVAPTIVTVAQKPPSEGAAAGSRLLLTGGPRSISKAVSIEFSRGQPVPRSVIKANRTPEAGAGLKREAENLRYLERHRPDLPGVPRVMSLTEESDIVRLVESPIAGTPLHGELSLRTLDAYAQTVIDWTVALAGRDARPAADAPLSDVVDPITKRFREDHSAVIDEREWQECRRILAGLREIPIVPEHRDLGPWNILVSRGSLGVLDWESAVLHGLPGLDLIYFLLYAVGYATGVRRHRRLIDVYRQVRHPATPMGALADKSLRRYCRAVGVDPEHLRALHILTWMVHARSEHRRHQEDAEMAAPGLGRQSLFFPLWRAELHVPRRT